MAVFQRGDVFQDVGAGGIGIGLALHAAGDLQAVEEDLAQLFRGADVELFRRRWTVDFLFQLDELLREGIGHAVQGVAVDLDAGHLHVGQHGDEGAFEGFIDGGDAGAVELRLEELPEAQGHIGVFGGVFDGVVDGDLVEGDLGFSAAEQDLIGIGWWPR